MSVSLPYFDLLFESFKQNEPAAKLFEQFVHWGYWQNPGLATKDAKEFLAAMDRLNTEILLPGEIQDGQTVLDAGCGFGGTLDSINRRYSNMRLFGVNIDPRQIAAARPRLQRQNGNTISFVEADACELPFPDASFDRVLAVECIFHFPSRLKFLQEASRVLRPGGRLALSDFVPARYGSNHWRLSHWLERCISKGYGTLGDNWSQGNYETMTSKAGLILELNRDITANTLPTYAVLKSLRFQKAMQAAPQIMWLPTLLLEGISRLGFLRYRILAFAKPS